MSKFPLVLFLALTVFGWAQDDPYVSFTLNCWPPAKSVHYRRGPSEAVAYPDEFGRFTVDRRHLASEAPVAFRVTARGYEGTARFRLADLQPQRPEELDDWKIVDWREAILGWIEIGGAPIWRVKWLLLAGLPIAVALANRRRRAQQHLARLRALLPNQTGDAWLGRSVGPYWPIRRLGAGGMATVYAAVRMDHPEPERPVALKIMKRSGRLQVEASAQFQLRHPSVLCLLDWGETGEWEYLVTEFVDGGTLKDRISREGMAWPQALHWFLPVLEAVAWAHSQGFLHRDIKPENVLISRQGEVKLGDFGLASKTDAASSAGEGSPEYMAPELSRGGSASPASDQYSLAVLLYQLLLGHLPWSELEPMARLLARSEQPPSIPPDLPEALQDVLTRCLDPDPNRRFASLSDLKAQLCALLE